MGGQANKKQESEASPTSQLSTQLRIILQQESNRGGWTMAVHMSLARRSINTFHTLTISLPVTEKLVSVPPIDSKETVHLPQLETVLLDWSGLVPFLSRTSYGDPVRWLIRAAPSL